HSQPCPPPPPHSSPTRRSSDLAVLPPPVQEGARSPRRGPPPTWSCSLRPHVPATAVSTTFSAVSTTIPVVDRGSRVVGVGRWSGPGQRFRGSARPRGG